jgi:NAD(P)-dependent dehydrogenase (short-subunit alcohol dehydrogenase family)
VYSHHVDVTSETSVAELVQRATSLGRVSLVCLNVGVNSPGHVVWDTPVAVFDAIIDINLRGLFNSLRGFVPVLKANPEPAQIVVTASIGGLVSTPFAGVYSASKAGVIALAKALRDELAADSPQLGVVLLAPDIVQTDFILNSADVLGPTVVADPAITQAAHDYMSQQGITATEAATWVLDAIDKGDFWALPSADEPSVVALRSELRLLDEMLG